MKRKLSAEAVDQNLKKKLVEIIETAEKRAADNMTKMTDSLDRLTDTITDGFSVLRQVMQSMPPPPPPHYSSFPFQGQAYAPMPPPPPHNSYTVPTNLMPLGRNVSVLRELHGEGREDATSYTDL